MFFTISLAVRTIDAGIENNTKRLIGNRKRCSFRTDVLSNRSARISYCNFNKIGVRSFILNGAPVKSITYVIIVLVDRKRCFGPTFKF